MNEERESGDKRRGSRRGGYGGRGGHICTIVHCTLHPYDTPIRDIPHSTSMPRDILLLRAVLSVCLLLWAAAASTSDRVVLAPSKVTSVKIHGNKAEVSREFELAEYEDDSYILVRVDGLTNQLEDKSVRVKGVGRAEIIESSVSSRAVPRDLDPVYGAQLSFLQRLAAHAAAAVETSKAALQRAAAQKEYVQSYTKASIASKPSLPTGDSTAPSPMLSIQAMTEILAFQDSVAAEMDVKAATAARDVAVGSARLRAIQSSVDALRSRGVYTPYTEEGLLYCPSDMDCSAPSLATATTWPLSAAAKAVEVRVRTGSAAPGRPKPALKFSLSYMAGPARWYPEYDIRLEGDSAQSSRQYSIEVDYYAAVEQQTMEVNVHAVVDLMCTILIPDYSHPVCPELGWCQYGVVNDQPGRGGAPPAARAARGVLRGALPPRRADDDDGRRSDDEEGEGDEGERS